MLSILFHPSSIILILLSEGQAGEVWQPLNKILQSPKAGALEMKALSVYLVFKRVKFGHNFIKCKL